MNVYTVAPATDGWQVLKVGRFFCMADSEHTASSLAASLNSALTPRTAAHLKAQDVFQPSALLNETERRASRKFSATSWKRTAD